MTCTHCATPIPEGGRFCPTCGADATDPGAQGRTTTPGTDLTSQALHQLKRAVEGHYRVERVLARGGMGVVLLAEDLVLGRPVAIKMLPPEYGHDEKLVGRFETEARTAAKLDHPSIVPIFSVESNGGCHFFVMKYITGRSLQELLEQGPMPLELCQNVLADAARALGHAHKRGLMHRDIKPGNIMVDEDGHTVIMDFGISKAVQAAVSFTATGQIVGTPQYMSPEQAKGMTLDGRSDQYSLALVGYQMLTGRQCFEGDSAHVVLYKQISEPPPPIEPLRPDTPPHLVAAIMRALAKDPGQRFQTMGEFAAAVQNRTDTSQATPASARALTPVPPTLVSAKARRPIGMWLGVGGVAVAAIAIAMLVMNPRRGETPAAGAAAPAPAAAVPAPPAESSATPAVPASAEPPAGSASRPNEPAAEPPASRAQRQPPREPAQRTQAPAAPAAPVQAPAPAPAPAPAAVETGYLTIDSDPFGTVSIDGVDAGDTPLIRRALRPGTYAVRINHEGYRPWSGSITITAGNTVSRRVQLVPQ